MKPLIVDLPYPTLKNIKEDLTSAYIISPAYAGLKGELTAILSYTYHGFYMQKCGYDETMEVLESIAMAEMIHFKTLGTLMLKLGLDPIYGRTPPRLCNFYDTSEVSYSETPQKMLLDDLAGEMLAISGYDYMLKTLKNEEVASVIQRIKLDEELHVKALKEQLEKLSLGN